MGRLTGARVILTRSAAAARPFALAIEALGGQAIAMPVTVTAPPSPDEERAVIAAASRIGSYDAVVLASVIAVERLMTALRAAGRSPADLNKCVVVAVGPATAAALMGLGVTARVPERADATGAAEAVLAAGVGRGRQILVPRAAGGRDEAVEILRAAGAEVDALCAYRTVTAAPDPSLELVIEGGVVVALFAPSQVTALGELLDLSVLDRSIVAAIGGTTAAALTSRGVRVDAVASAPEPAAMASAIAAVYPVG